MKKLLVLMLFVFTVSLTFAQDAKQVEAEKIENVEGAKAKTVIIEKAAEAVEDATQIEAAKEQEEDNRTLWTVIVAAVTSIITFLGSMAFKSVFKTAQTIADLTETDIDNKIIDAISKVLEVLGIDPETDEVKKAIRSIADKK